MAVSELALDRLLTLQTQAEDIVVIAVDNCVAGSQQGFHFTYKSRFVHSNQGESQVHARFGAP